MPRRFNPQEEAEIRERLKTSARRLFPGRGVAKTTIDALTRAGGIAKGSFYRFYASKEQLFFELLEESQNALRAPLLQTAPRSRNERLAELRLRLNALVESFMADPMLAVITRQDELANLSTRVPKNVLDQHRLQDRRFIEKLIECWSGQDPPAIPVDKVAADVTLLVLTCLQRDFFGDHLFPIARETVIDALCERLAGA